MKFDFTPDPKVLIALTHTPMQPLDALCELIDNAIDSFYGAKIQGLKADNPMVIVTLPSRKQLSENGGILRIQDNGPGMSPQNAEKAIKAGFSGNNPYDTLGLFGMGFNISTGKLGNITTFMTSREDMDSYVKTVIDLEKINSTKDYSLDAEKIAKASDDPYFKPGSHGTIIEVKDWWPQGNANSGFVQKLVQYGLPKIREEIGRRYATILRKGEIKIFINEGKCEAYEHCVWDDSRYVVRKSGNVPAVMRFDQVVGSTKRCGTCTAILGTSDTCCPSCGSTKIRTVEERVRGWIGIQRFDSDTDFGIDLIRNGRAIRIGEKNAFFEYVDEFKHVTKDYPIDSQYGRIVGEINLDFVPVDFLKQDFQRSSAEWQRAMTFIRGNSSLQPSQPGASENNSPLYKLSKIDMVITKSISRFARNTLDCLKYIRQLKEKNISVYFEKENINTMDAKGEVLLTIMASLAQQESQSLSQNVKLGLQFRYQAGKVQVNHNRFLGYTKDDEGNLVIVPEEAEIVLRIYREYLEGASLFQIGQGLEADGIKTAAGSDYWLQSTLKKILTNEKYIGDALLQKTYTVDFLNKKRVANNGIVPQYYVENSHPAIIPREKFMKVREEMYRRAHMECGPDQKRRIYSSRYALSSIVYCAHCNDIFRRINWNNRGCKSTVWRCLSRVEKDRPSCTARTVKEELLHEVVVRAVNEVITGSSSFIPALQASFERCLGDSNSAAVEGIDAHLLELQQELLKLANAKQNYETLADEIDELRAEKEELLLQEANKEGIRQRIADMMAYLQSEPEEVTEYSEALVRRMIEKITVYDDHFVVEFKSGIEITINE